VRKLPGKLRFRPDFHHPAVRKLARLSAWTLGYVVSNQIGFGVGLVLANRVQGGPTAMFTAFSFFQLPYGVAAVSIMTALVPRMSSQAVEGDLVAFRASVGSGMRVMGLLLLPATAAYLVLSRPLVTTLLQHGVMTRGSSELVARVLDMFALGLVPFSFFLLLLRAFYARQDARMPTLVNLVLNTVYIGLAIPLFALWKVPGLALAHTSCYVVGATLAAVLLRRRIGGLEGRRTAIALAKVLGASAVAAGAMAVVVELLGGEGGGASQALVQLLVGGAAGLAVFLVVARLVGVEELDALRRLIPGRARVARG
jgi:putative peptidoglycan lipid II flippase